MRRDDRPAGPPRAAPPLLGPAKLLWRLRVSEAPPGYLHFVVNPWVVSNEKLKDTLGWAPRHSTRETFEVTARARGLLGDGHDPSASSTPSRAGAAA